MGRIILFSIGSFGTIYGFWLLSGGKKGQYFARHLYASSIYGLIPVGICFLLLWAATLDLFQQINTVLVNLGLGLGLVSVLFNIIPPRFLKPAWLRWLEREHGDIMALLIKDAHEMGLDVWEERVKHQEGLEAWVNEVRDKHNR